MLTYITNIKMADKEQFISLLGEKAKRYFKQRRFRAHALGIQI